MAAPLPLLERDAARAVLHDALASAAAGAGRVVLVSGEAGIGKTTLVDRFLQDAGRATMLRGACEALFTPHPLGPLHDIARDAPPLLREQLASRLHADGDRPLLFATVLDALARRPGPTLLVLEDVHWADAATLDLVRHIGRRIERLPALLVLTYRDDELDAHPALRLALGDLPARALARVPLARLSPLAVAALARAAGVSDSSVYLASGGNPFFVTELLRHPESKVPVTVRDSVLGRAARLAPGPRALLDLVACVPRAAELALVDAVAKPALDAIDACVSCGLLVAEADDAAFPPRARPRRRGRRARRRRARGNSAPTCWSCCAAQRAAARMVPLARLAHHARFADDRAPRSPSSHPRRRARRRRAAHAARRPRIAPRSRSATRSPRPRAPRCWHSTRSTCSRRTSSRRRSARTKRPSPRTRRWATCPRRRSSIPHTR